MKWSQPLLQSLKHSSRGVRPAWRNRSSVPPLGSRLEVEVQGRADPVLDVARDVGPADSDAALGRVDPHHGLRPGPKLKVSSPPVSPSPVTGVHQAARPSVVVSASKTASADAVERQLRFVVLVETLEALGRAWSVMSGTSFCRAPRVLRRATCTSRCL